MVNFSTDWLSANIKLWDNNKSSFSGIPNKRCLEIGAFEGRSTLYLAQNYCNGKNSIVDSVDIWGYSSDHSKSLEDDLLDRFKNNLSEYIDEGRVIVNQGTTAKVLVKFLYEIQEGTREKYDFVYIDASHTAKDVLMDTVLSWEMLNVGGMMYFDDYKWEKYADPALNPKVAIDGFLNSYAGAYKLIHKGYQVHIQKLKEAPADVEPAGLVDSVSDL